jgi:hypothetical protein
MMRNPPQRAADLERIAEWLIANGPHVLSEICAALDLRMPAAIAAVRHGRAQGTLFQRVQHGHQHNKHYQSPWLWGHISQCPVQIDVLNDVERRATPRAWGEMPAVCKVFGMVPIEHEVAPGTLRVHRGFSGQQADAFGEN